MLRTQMKLACVKCLILVTILKVASHFISCPLFYFIFLKQSNPRMSTKVRHFGNPSVRLQSHCDIVHWVGIPYEASLLSPPPAS